MTKVSTRFITALVFLSLFLPVVYAQQPTWPVKNGIDLSSGYGDYRQYRFHVGIDIRTGGKTGWDLISPVDGYVYRVKMSYAGYGRGLYIKGDDGHIYVFGHLADFARKINQPVRKAQKAAQRYYVDLYYPADSIRVSKGELLGHTGQSGIGAPHLHFEKRSAENVTLNPVNHGYPVDDDVRPLFSRVGFQLLDNHSLFVNGSRKIYLPVRPTGEAGKYTLDTVLYFNSPFGLLADCFDRMRVNGMKQAVHRLTLFIDKKQQYEIVFDTLTFDVGRTVALNYDYVEAVNDSPRNLRLYRKTGNSYDGARPSGKHGGIVGWNGKLSIGTHVARMVAEDCAGNTSELEFTFLWGPEHDLLVADTTVIENDSLWKFPLVAAKELSKLEVDSIYFEVYDDDAWRILEGIRPTNTGDRKYELQMPASEAKLTSYRPILVTKTGCGIIGTPFNGWTTLQPKEIRYDIRGADGGLEILARSRRPHAGTMYMRAFFEDQMTGDPIRGKLIIPGLWAFYLPPDSRYKKLDQLDMSRTPDHSFNNHLSQKVMLYLAEPGDQFEMTGDSLFALRINPDCFFEPTFVSLQRRRIHNKSQFDMNSDLYRIKPDAFITAADLDVLFKLEDSLPRKEKSGLCWLDEKKDRWVWLEDNANDGAMIEAGSQGGGSFGLLIDEAPPRIKKLSIRDGATVPTPRPRIRFTLEDELSGIADDRNIQVFIDDEWMIPEYDMETKLCSVRPDRSLHIGEHTLRIEVSDRAGNSIEQKLRFNVRKTR